MSIETDNCSDRLALTLIDALSANDEEKAKELLVTGGTALANKRVTSEGGQYITPLVAAIISDVQV